MTLMSTDRWRRLAARAAVLLLLAAGSLAAAGLAQPAAASTPRVPLTGVVQVSDTTESDPDEPNDDLPLLADAVCPYPKTVVGVGWSTNPSSSELRLQALVPNERSAYVVVHEDYDRYEPDWSVTVYVTCADRPAGWSLSSSWGSWDSDGYQTARADCPDGTAPLGSGFEQSTGNGQVVVTDINPDFTGVHVAAYEHEDGLADDWRVRAHAICADPPSGWALYSSNNQTTYPHASEYTPCTGDARAVSSGADLNGAHGEVVLKSLRTISVADGDYGSATASEDRTGTPDDWTFTNDVICVDR